MAILERLLRSCLGAAALSICAATASFASAADVLPSAPPLVLAQADPDAAPDDGQSASGLLIRIERLEDRIRSMTGQIEQLQFQNKKLDDELRKMQQDVDFRFQDLGRGAQPGAVRTAPQKRGDAGSASEAAALDGSPPVVDTSALPAKSARRTGDAFDPSTEPDAPGTPKPLGTTAPSEPLPARPSPTRRSTDTPPVVSQPHAPMNLMPRAVEGAVQPEAAPPHASVSAIEAQPDSTAESRPPASPSGVASLVPGGTRSEYDRDFALYKGGQYDAAATGFQSFIEKYPRDRLAGDATYFLGESYARLGRHREAAEQFLRLSTDFNRSSHAPDALLRLGIALNALGAKEQACATYQEVDRKFPTASADVRAGVERELKRSKC